MEKSHVQIEVREYYQTEQIEWMQEKERWKSLKTIGCIVKTIQRKEKTVTEIRYYISSLKEDMGLSSKVCKLFFWGYKIMLHISQ